MNELNQFIDGPPSPSNYVFVPHNFQLVAGNLSRFPVGNGCLHAAQKDNRYYVVRVISAGGQGQNNLHILRILSTSSPDNLLSNNHILPIVTEIVYQDIHFAVFPKVGPRIQVAMMPLVQKNTIEDIVYIIMQALEVRLYNYLINRFLLPKSTVITGSYIHSWQKCCSSCMWSFIVPI